MGDVQKTQQQAVLQRLALTVEKVLEAEQLFPEKWLFSRTWISKCFKTRLRLHLQRYRIKEQIIDLEQPSNPKTFYEKFWKFFGFKENANLETESSKDNFLPAKQETLLGLKQEMKELKEKMEELKDVKKISKEVGQLKDLIEKLVKMKSDPEVDQSALVEDTSSDSETDSDREEVLSK